MEPLLAVLSVLLPWEGEVAASCGHCAWVATVSTPLTFLFSSTRGRVLRLSALCCVISTASDCEQDLSMCLHLACMGRHVLKRRTVQMFPAD